MRITFLYLILGVVLGLYLWATLSGALLVLSYLFILFIYVISIGYVDSAILFFLGAREIKSGDEANFRTAAVQEAYKLAVPLPKLYFYNGSLERAFVLQNNHSISLVISRDLLDVCSKDELTAICFELLLQVKKNMASKRTKVMFLIGFMAWMVHGLSSVLFKILPFKEFKQCMDFLMFYMVHPWFEIIFKLTVGKKYFFKLQNLLKDFPVEQDLLNKIGSKIRRPNEIYSLPSKKLLQFSSVNKNRHYQNILTLEFMPHEWDLIFNSEEGTRA